jgi:hypothetical protein
MMISFGVRELYQLQVNEDLLGFTMYCEIQVVQLSIMLLRGKHHFSSALPHRMYPTNNTMKNPEGYVYTPHAKEQLR